MKPYWGIGAIVGFPVFVVAWLYCVVEYGFMVGVLLGWLPAAIVGCLAAALWPVIALGAAVAWLR